MVMLTDFIQQHFFIIYKNVIIDQNNGFFLITFFVLYTKIIHTLNNLNFFTPTEKGVNLSCPQCT